MSYDQAKITVEEIKEALPKFSRRQILEWDQKIHDSLETSQFTRASENAFSEWEDPEKDIYNADV